MGRTVLAIRTALTWLAHCRGPAGAHPGGIVPGYGAGVDPLRGTVGPPRPPKACPPSPCGLPSNTRPVELAVFWPKISSQIPWLPGWCFQPTIQTRCFQLSGALPPWPAPACAPGRSDPTQESSIRDTHSGAPAAGQREREPAWASGLTPPRMAASSPADLLVGEGWGG